MRKSLKLVDLKIVFATREFANFAIQSAIAEKCKEISLREVDSISRSFLDELYLRVLKNNLNIVEIPENIQPLMELIKRSHQDQVMYAPKIKIKISNTTFA